MRQRETGATDVTVSGVQARNPLADGIAAENDFPIPELADEEGFRADAATETFTGPRWASRPAGGQEV
jgi:hypothetical protein